ncbi:hypothetical protein AVDCRST_MAG94-2453 [uncultured Leptolyngbya sp.]|uniref:Uncharacterized protein n=1 Tax=uncultured Leptolyngbya sp. TaxID=332963 RepID=A0A6J4LX06_9CYAN|nr:hypothetical protein AVDCRST_MAG94-2453 [uncultured Leptolyngbya sp.]
MEWARSIETSHYYHYGDQPEPKRSTAPHWNQQQQAAARTRITQAIADLLNNSNRRLAKTVLRLSSLFPCYLKVGNNSTSV